MTYLTYFIKHLFIINLLQELFARECLGPKFKSQVQDPLFTSRSKVRGHQTEQGTEQQFLCPVRRRLGDRVALHTYLGRAANGRQKTGGNLTEEGSEYNERPTD